MYIGLHAVYSCSILMKLESSRQIFEEFSNIKFHENLPSGSRIVTSGQTDKTQLTVVFRNFAKAPKRINWYDNLRSLLAANIRMCVNITVDILFRFSSCSLILTF